MMRCVAGFLIAAFLSSSAFAQDGMIISGTVKGPAASSSNTLELQNKGDAGLGLFRTDKANTIDENFIAFFARTDTGTIAKTMSISEIMRDTSTNGRYSVVRLNSNYSRYGISTDYIGIRIWGGRGVTINGVGEDDTPNMLNPQSRFKVRETAESWVSGTMPAHWIFRNNAANFSASYVGSISSPASGTMYNTVSDANLTPGSGEFPPSVARSILRRLSVQSTANDAAVTLAQEVHAIYPSVVTVGSGQFGDAAYTPWQIDYSKLVPLLIGAAQDQDKQLARLERGLNIVIAILLLILIIYSLRLFLAFRDAR